jgi:hypothetical protein
MNPLNHFIFAVGISLIFVDLTLGNILLILVFSLIFANLIDIDHFLNKKAPWYHKRTWIQEPFGVIFIGLPLAILLSFFNKIYFILVIVPYISHLILDYLCTYRTYPLSPFSNWEKEEGKGIFFADNLFSKTRNSIKWQNRTNSRGISENYFTLFNFILLIFVILVKLNFF